MPFPPGGSNDVLARYFAAKMTERVKEQVVIDNRGGAKHHELDARRHDDPAEPSQAGFAQSVRSVGRHGDVKMNCLTCRQQLLISRRDLGVEQRAHIAACHGCARLMAALADVDRHIEEAALVPVPDGLAHRILLARRRRPIWQYASAAGLLLALVIAVAGAVGVLDATMFPSPVQAVGPIHPVVAAISVVVNDTTELAQSGNTAEMDHQLKALGLQLNAGEVHAHYGGKCQLLGAQCDLIVLDTPDARANVVLVPDYPIAGRVLVADRRMVALATPAKTGAYVVVADSPKVVKRMNRLFRRG